MTLQQNACATPALKLTEPNLGIADTSIPANNKPKTTLERLKQQQKILTNRIHKAESRQRENERKQETRRKILVGAYFLNKARQTNNMAELTGQLSTFLTRDSDRALFNLSIDNPEGIT